MNANIREAIRRLEFHKTIRYLIYIVSFAYCDLAFASSTTGSVSWPLIQCRIKPSNKSLRKLSWGEIEIVHCYQSFIFPS